MATRTVVFVGIVTFALGCSKSGSEKPTPVISVGTTSPTTKPADATTLPPNDDPTKPVYTFQPRSVTFSDAVTENSPEEQMPPPDRTLNGLSTGKLREAVQKQFEQVGFTAPSGRKLAYTAMVDTEYGPVTMALLPEVAPNHVRNFIALARAGYYDGLLFEHVVQQEGEGGAKLEMIEGGCPLGTGEPGIGHLGYWLKPEFSDKVTHEEGTVGACRDDQPDSAACRFYITLSKAPVLDGNYTVFAKVTQGLDAVRKIGQLPRPDGSNRPLKPAGIRKVTIQTREVD
ncbi:MAG: peptidylprolyl isomerase [Gemmataceae bacterium]